MSTAPSTSVPAPLARRRVALDDYVRLWLAIAGDACLGIVAYGPAVAGHDTAAIDTAVVLASDDLAPLRALARHGARLERTGLAAPLVLTRETIAASRDTFALELLDLAQCRHVLHGADDFADASFAIEHVRLQCERELKSLGLAVRRRLLAAAGAEDALAAIDLGDAMVRIARGLLLLRGRGAPADAAATLRAAGDALGRPLTATLAAWRGATGYDALAAFDAEVAALWRMVDAA